MTQLLIVKRHQYGLIDAVSGVIYLDGSVSRYSLKALFHATANFSAAGAFTGGDKGSWDYSALESRVFRRANG
ncbi:MAG TPA: hypothetical protein VJ728_08645 [Candidatus Binataceae bacterium]|nr:hypothetical protein [Candidatus Binataceae bacterium]